LKLLLLSKIACGQAGPLRFSSPFECENCLDTALIFTNNSIPDSMKVALARLEFRETGNTSNRKIWLALGNSGGLLAFSDSILNSPLLLEKRNGIPFHKPLPNSTYKLVYTFKIGPDSYFACRLVSESGEFVLDEILLCMPNQNTQMKFKKAYNWISAK
jgi:hypothetical protein